MKEDSYLNKLDRIEAENIALDIYKNKSNTSAQQKAIDELVESIKKYSYEDSSLSQKELNLILANIERKIINHKKRMIKFEDAKKQIDLRITSFYEVINNYDDSVKPFILKEISDILQKYT